MLMMHRKWEKLHQEGRDEEVSWKFWQKQYSFREQYGVGLDPDELEGLWLRLQILVFMGADFGSLRKNLSNLGNDMLVLKFMCYLNLTCTHFACGDQSLVVSTYIPSQIHTIHR